MSARLEIDRLCKRYGAVAAVESLSHRFAPGKLTVIVGPSGSGKTTALSMIAGLVAPDTGRVTCDGEDITQRPAERRDFGVVFQSYALFPHMSVRENAEFGLRVRGVPAAARRQRANAALERVRIGALAERRIDQLSGGEQQRVALARALAYEPRVLLLDEPLSALDAQLREQLRVELLALLEALGLTAVYVTHDQVEAMALAHELIVMNAGRIEQRGAPQHVYAEPANRFVAGFLGSANLLDGVCSERGGRRVLALGFAQLELPNGAPSGSCCAVLRPEDLEIVETSSGHFAAVVEATSFLGDRVRLQLEAAGTRLLADAPSRVLPVRGERVGVRVRMSRLRLLPAEEKAR